MALNLPEKAGPVLAPLSEDESIDLVQNVRRNMLTKLIEGGVPTDPKEAQTVMALLNDMDRTSLTIKKIGAKEKSNNADRQAAVLIAEMTSRLGSRSPFLASAEVIEHQPRLPPPELDESQVTELTLAPGETEIGTSTETYEEFMTRMEAGGTVAGKGQKPTDG